MILNSVIINAINAIYIYQRILEETILGWECSHSDLSCFTLHLFDMMGVSHLEDKVR